MLQEVGEFYEMYVLADKMGKMTGESSLTCRFFTPVIKATAFPSSFLPGSFCQAT
jgi:hypothetical protein